MVCGCASRRGPGWRQKRVVPLFDDGGPTKEMLYVIGGAAVGKSTYIKQNLAMTHIIIDPDTLKDVCPLKDPDPDAKGSPTYLWTKKRVAELMESALAEPGRYVIVGTGGTTGSERPQAEPGRPQGICKAGRTDCGCFERCETIRPTPILHWRL